MEASLPPLSLSALNSYADNKSNTHSSRVTCFSVGAAAAMIFFPVAEEPVKEILAMYACFVINGPRLSSPPSA